MKNVTELMTSLSASFPESDISWRAGAPSADKSSAVVLPHIDPRLVQARLDETVGPEGWKVEFREVVAGAKLVSVVCSLALRCDGEWVAKEDAAHVSEAVNVLNEFAIKGAYTEAFKRAAVMWGVGRYLYRMPRVRAALDSNMQPVMTAAVWEQLGLSAPQASAAQAPAPVATSTVREEAAASAPAAPSKPAAVETVSKATAAPVAAPAPQPEPEPVAAAEVAAPAPSPEELARQAVQAQVLGQPMDAPAPAPAPVSAPAPAPAAQESADTPAGYPKNLTDTEKKLVDELTVKVKKLPPSMVRSYIEGPKGKQNLSEESRTYLLSLVDQKEGKA